MKKTIRIYACTLTIITFFYSTSSAQTASTDSLAYYEEHFGINADYNGVEGHSLGIEFGKRKFCFDCKKQHRKFWGLGLEGARSTQQEWLFGPRIAYQRGSEQFAIRLAAIAYTSNFKDIIAVVRPELLFYPTKQRNWSIGVHFNVNKNFTEDSIYADFGILGITTRYEFGRLQ